MLIVGVWCLRWGPERKEKKGQGGEKAKTPTQTNCNQI